MSTFRIIACSICIILLFKGCKTRSSKSPDHLGEISFSPTGKADAQPSFKKGLLLLHSFEYVDAAEEFLQVQKIDPDFVMAYWGEAMTYNHPLWQEQDYKKGNEILLQLASTPEERIAKAKTALEKDFIGGINILYGKGNKAERDSSYAAYMATLYKKYPVNDEVASFYSLSLNGWGTTGLQKNVLEEAAAIAFKVMERNPSHPGALHYLIHAYDNPDNAAKALATADKYAIIAKDAGHALHMPTHTYLALGLWDKVISSNEVSWAAEQKRKERKSLGNDALGYHSYHWLQYGYLQKGNKEKARSMLDSMQQFCTALPSPRARGHLIFLKTTYLAETNDYSNDIVNISVQQNDLNITTRSRNYFVKGMNAYYKKNADELHDILLKLSAERLIEGEKMVGNGLKVCGNINRALPTKTDLQETEVMELQLKAMQAWMKKDAAAENFLKQATKLQTVIGHSYGPPAIVKPSFEMYGEWLLENNRPNEALEQFNLSLQMMPNKNLSLKGKAMAEEKSKAMASL